MNIRALVAEFIGTFTLVFIGIAAIGAGSMIGLTGIGLAHGLAFAVMVSATAAISGGHLNPAVTFGALVARKISVVNAAGYIVAQCLGAIAAAYVVKMAVPEQIIGAIQVGLPAIRPGISLTQGFVTETVLTFFLVFVVFGTMIDKRAPKVGGLFIGLAVAMGVMVGAPMSGAAMNPARHLGPAVASGLFDNIWLYWAAPLLGGLLAGLVYGYFLEERESSTS
jgi:aquaporin Z